MTIAITGCVWYVHNNAPGNAGTSTAPFDTLAQAETASAAGHTIFVFDGDNTTTGYAAGINLKANQRLIGEAARPAWSAPTCCRPPSRPTGPRSPTTTPTSSSSTTATTVRGFVIDPQGTGGGIAGGTGDTGRHHRQRRRSSTPAPRHPARPRARRHHRHLRRLRLTVDNSSPRTRARSASGSNNAGTVNFAAAGHDLDHHHGRQGPRRDRADTSLGTSSVFDDITVTASGTGGVSMTNTTGTVALGDDVGRRPEPHHDLGGTGASCSNNAGNVTVRGGGTDEHRRHRRSRGRHHRQPATSPSTTSTPPTAPATASTSPTSAEAASPRRRAARSPDSAAGGVGFDLDGGATPTSPTTAPSPPPATAGPSTSPTAPARHRRLQRAITDRRDRGQRRQQQRDDHHPVRRRARLRRPGATPRSTPPAAAPSSSRTPTGSARRRTTP